MCMGIPYEIVQSGYPLARGKAGDGECDIDMSLVGEVPVGTHVLTFLGAAREVISADTANQIANALEALRLVMTGDGDIDHLFADLANREQQLPEHLRTPEILNERVEA